MSLKPDRIVLARKAACLKASNCARALRDVTTLLLCGLAILTQISQTHARAEDLSEALRLWKFTYQLELTAYGVKYMSADLLQKAGDQLDTAAGQTVMTSTPMRVCIDASYELAKYFRLSTPPVKARARLNVRKNYEANRAGCMRLLGADPAAYPLGWPN